MRLAPVSNINPAQSLVLTHEEHALLGDLVEIMGLIEGMLIESVARVDPITSARLRKLPAGPQAKLWADALIGRVSDSTISSLIPSALLELRHIAEDRNDFVHALYEGDYVQAGLR
jgi:hypothetical protein